MLSSHDFPNTSEIVLALLETHRSLQVKVVPFLSTVMLPIRMLHYQISAVTSADGAVTECYLSTYFYRDLLNKKSCCGLGKKILLP